MLTRREKHVSDWGTHKSTKISGCFGAVSPAIISLASFCCVLGTIPQCPQHRSPCLRYRFSVSVALFCHSNQWETWELIIWTYVADKKPWKNVQGEGSNSRTLGLIDLCGGWGIGQHWGSSHFQMYFFKRSFSWNVTPAWLKDWLTLRLLADPV